MSSSARADFIRAHTALLPVPHAPEIKLYLAHEALELWQKTEEELEAIGLPPPFWAFAWAGGQALARYVLDHPQIVAGKSVFDLASGSGLVAIAAAMAGAREVIANEIDDFALASIALNAQVNDVRVEVVAGDMIGRDEGWDVVLAGDVSYERDMAAEITGWLAQLHERGCTVLIGDPGRSYLARERLEAIAEYQVPVTRALEDAEVKRSSVWRFKSG